MPSGLLLHFLGGFILSISAIGVGTNHRRALDLVLYLALFKEIFWDFSANVLNHSFLEPTTDILMSVLGAAFALGISRIRLPASRRWPSATPSFRK